MSFKWNLKDVISSTVWNPQMESEGPVLYEASLKERLYSPINGKRDSDHIGDIGKGIAMIMDYIESKENES